MGKSLKRLAKVLELSEGYLKGLQKGKKRHDDDFIRLNTANACRAMAKFTGYKNEESARKAITANIHQLYMPLEVYVARLERILPKYGKVKRPILTKAVMALKSGNFKEYNRLIHSNKELHKFKRKCAKNVKKPLIDKFRSMPKSNRAMARGMRINEKSPNGEKIIVPKGKIDAEVEKRVKRHGSTASLFWQSARQLNPKIKPDGLSKQKRKKHKSTHGASFKTNAGGGAVSATVQHRAEINGRYKQKLLKRIAQQERFWAGQAEKQILAAKYLGRLIERG